jgi:hypothetical protein
MLAGISTRQYPVALEPVGEQVEQVASSTSKSAVSRRFVTATAERLAELSARPLGDQRWLIVFIDGFSFADHTLLGALGVTADTRRETSPITYPKPSARWSSANCGRRGPSHRLPKPRVTWRRSRAASPDSDPALPPACAKASTTP